MIRPGGDGNGLEGWRYAFLPGGWGATELDNASLFPYVLAVCAASASRSSSARRRTSGGGCFLRKAVRGGPSRLFRLLPSPLATALDCPVLLASLCSPCELIVLPRLLTPTGQV